MTTKHHAAPAEKGGAKATFPVKLKLSSSKLAAFADSPESREQITSQSAQTSQINSDAEKPSTRAASKRKSNHSGGPAKNGSDASAGETSNPVSTGATHSGKKRGGARPMLKSSGIQKVDNKLKSSLFQPMPSINQKNYYTDYLRRDDQLLAYKKKDDSANKVDSAKHEVKADDGNDGEDDNSDSASDGDEEAAGAKVIVIHPGSRFLKIGLASDVYPKTIANVVARKQVTAAVQSEDEEKPLPVREILEDGSVYLGRKFAEAKSVVVKDFRERMRFYKRRILPNSNETVANFNLRSTPEVIPDHNDPYRVEWVEFEDIRQAPPFITGDGALRLSDTVSPHYKLRWPIRYGRFNEDPRDYTCREEVLSDVSTIISDSLQKEFSLTPREFSEYRVILLIPDLYDKAYVQSFLQLLLQLSFESVALLQESVAATFGAGISSACVVDVGSQKTSITCVDEGGCLPDSRIHMPYGGDDLTVAFTKLLLASHFPYKELDLRRTCDFQLMDDLKSKHITFQDGEIAIQLYNFYCRSPSQATRKYDLKVFDEVMLAPLGLFYPCLFEIVSVAQTPIKGRLTGAKEMKAVEDESEDDFDTLKIVEDRNKYRYRLFSLSRDLYDDSMNEPTSEAQKAVQDENLVGLMTPEELSLAIVGPNVPQETAGTAPGSPITKQSTPVPGATDGDSNMNVLTSGASESEADKLAELTKPAVAPLDYAIIESIARACKHDIPRSRKFYDNLLFVGGGAAKIPGLDLILSDRIGMWRPEALSSNGAAEALFNEAGVPIPWRKAANGPGAPSIASMSTSIYPTNIMPPPRDMDPQIMSWKGASVFAKLKIANELWISSVDWDMFGSRILQYKLLFQY